jgi:Putative Zn-dependent protease, contains TPR repeats
MRRSLWSKIARLRPLRALAPLLCAMLLALLLPGCARPNPQPPTPQPSTPPSGQPAPANPVVQSPADDLARAEKLLREGPDQDPEAALALVEGRAEPRAQLARIQALRLLERFEDAVAAANRLILADPRLPAAFVERGRTLYLMGHNDRALEDCTAALGIDPRDLDALLVQGDIFFALEMPGPAEASYSRAIAAAPANPVGYVNRGVVRDEQGHFAEAIADYDRALKLDPASATAYANRGVSRSQSGDIPGMCADYRKACDLGQCRRLTDARLMDYCHDAP